MRSFEVVLYTMFLFMLCYVCVTAYDIWFCRTFQHLWKEVANNISSYKVFPRLIGG